MSKSHEKLVADLDFIGSEISRLNDIAKSDLTKIQPLDALCHINHPDRGIILIGRKAEERVAEISVSALRGTVYSQRIHYSKIVKGIKKSLYEMLASSPAMTGQQIQKSISKIIKDAAKDCKDRTHFFPAHLMAGSNRRAFSLGNIHFQPTDQFAEESAPLIEAMIIKSSSRGRSLEDSRKISEEAIAYYRSFPWVVRVTIPGCDEIIARERAEISARTSIDLIRLLGSDRNTRRMSVGGFRVFEQLQAHLEAFDSAMHWTLTRKPLGEGGFDGWYEWLVRADNEQVILPAGKCLEVLRAPDVNWPLAARWIDAVSWFGQAVQDSSDAGAVIKFVTAMERMVMTGEKGSEKVYATFCERSAALIFSPGENFDEIKSRVAKIYDVRSKLAHGSLSPFSAEASIARSQSADFSRTLLLKAVAFAYAFGHVDQQLTVKQVGEIWNSLVSKISLDQGSGLFESH